MNPLRFLSYLAVGPALLLTALPLWAQAPASNSSMAEVVEQVNRKMVKLFGAGGFRGANSYGTGVLISADGYVLTASSLMLDTADLRVHLSDGRRYQAKV